MLHRRTCKYTPHTHTKKFESKNSLRQDISIWIIIFHFISGWIGRYNFFFWGGGVEFLVERLHCVTSLMTESYTPACCCGTALIHDCRINVKSPYTHANIAICFMMQLPDEFRERALFLCLLSSRLCDTIYPHDPDNNVKPI